MKLSILLFIPLITHGIAIPNKVSSVCQQISINTNDTDCFVDLTIAIDMSTAMESVANFVTLTNSIMTDLLPKFNFNQTWVAGITFGATFSISPSYFNNYGDMCSWISDAQASATLHGLANSDLVSVFKSYKDDLFRNGRNYQKVLVVLTAISDDRQVQNSYNCSQDLRDGGVYIIVGALGPLAPSSNLYQLGSLSFNSTDFTVPSDNVTTNVCQFGGITINPATQTPMTATISADPPGSTTVTPTDPRSNAIGTPCSTNVSIAWLDIVLAIDVSSGMSDGTLEEVAGQLCKMMSNFTIGQVENHTTRIAIVTYSSYATVQYDLTNFTSASDFIRSLKNLTSFSEPEDDNVDTRLALITAYNLIKNSRQRVPVIIVIAAEYNEEGVNGALHVSKQIQEDGIVIMTIDFDAEGISNADLGTLASPGYNFSSTQNNILFAFPYSLTQINCVCPQNSIQFRVYNSAQNLYKKYADCFYGTTILTNVVDCSIRGLNGILASVTSIPKLSFIEDNLLPYQNQLNQTRKFIVGGHKSGNQWMWYDFDGTEYPFGDFPDIHVNSPNDQYSFYNRGVGFIYNLESMGNNTLPYVCETRACDTDNYCNLHV